MGFKKCWLAFFWVLFSSCSYTCSCGCALVPWVALSCCRCNSSHSFFGAKIDLRNSCFPTFGCMVLWWHCSSAPLQCAQAAALPGRKRLVMGVGMDCVTQRSSVLYWSIKAATWSETQGSPGPGFLMVAGRSDCLGGNSLQNGLANRCISKNERGDVVLLRAKEFGNFLNCLY